MTVLTQLSVGAFATIWLLQLLGASTRLGVAALASLLVGGLALAASTLHLGRPVHAYRALKMWRRSWLSREVLLFARVLGRRGGVRRRCSGCELPGSVWRRRADRAARHRRRDGQRLHLPRAVAAGLEHALHAAAVQPDRGDPRAAVRRGRRRRATRAGWRSPRRRWPARSATVLALRFFALRRLGQPRAERHGAAAVDRRWPSALRRCAASCWRSAAIVLPLLATGLACMAPAQSLWASRSSSRSPARFSAATCSSSASFRSTWPRPTSQSGSEAA